MEKNDHHLVLGELIDYLSGETLADTHDERYLQSMARILVDQCGYDRGDILKNQPLEVKAGDRAARIRVSFQIKFQDRLALVIQYAPGSLVTRRLSNLALSRALADYQIPVAVTYNGEDAEIIDGVTGKVLGQGLDALPSRAALAEHIEQLGDAAFAPLSQNLKEKAHRIVHACQVDGACPCDTDICILD